MKIFTEKITDAGELLEAATAFRISKTIFAAVSLRIFDWLANDPLNSKDLSRKMGVGDDALSRLLDACTSLGLLQKDSDRYQNTPLAAQYLCWSSDATLNHTFQRYNEIDYQAWGHLEKAISGYCLPLPTEAASSEAKIQFQMRMDGYMRLVLPELLAQFDLSEVKTLIDLGGGTGAFAIAVCEAYDHIEATVLDRMLDDEAVKDFANKMLEKSVVVNKSNVRFVGGDYRKGEFIQADLFVASRVLHHHSDSEIRKLMYRVFAATSPGGAFLIAEHILNDEKTGTIRAMSGSLSMLLWNGQFKQRSFKEFADLASEAGFTEEKRWEAGGGGIDGLLLRKP